MNMNNFHNEIWYQQAILQYKIKNNDILKTQDMS